MKKLIVLAVMAVFAINMMAQSSCCATSCPQTKENACAKVDDKKACKKECKQGECKQRRAVREGMKL